MAFSTVLSSFCTPKTQSSFLSSSQNPLFVSQTTSLVPASSTKKKLLLRRPQNYNYKNMIFPIEVNPRRRSSKVKASEKHEEEETYVRENVTVFPTKDDLAEALARDITELSKKFIKERGFFTVVLCGRSIVKLLRKLLEPRFKHSIDWSKWHFFWVEERVLPKDHQDSNFKFAYDIFLSKVPGLDMNKNVHSINGYDNLPAEKAAERLENELKLLMKRTGKDNKSSVIAPTSSSSSFPKFDLMLLNMGSEGHPDYIFQGDDEDSHDNKKWVTFTKDFPRTPKERVALTLPVINSSSNIIMVVTGIGNAGAVQMVLKGHHKLKELPVDKIAPHHGEMKWYLDRAADESLDRAADESFFSFPA